MSHIALLGAGSWGTALALQLARAGQTVKLWGHRPEHLAQLQQQRENARYLPTIKFPANLLVEPDLESALSGSAFILLVVPSHVFVETLERLRALNVAQPGAAGGATGKTADFLGHQGLRPGPSAQ